MKKILFALFACFISIFSFADSRVLIDTTTDGTQYYGYAGTLEKGKDGWALLIGVRDAGADNETRMVMGVSFRDCNSSVGTLNRFDSNTNSWTRMAYVTTNGNTIGDSIARAICVAGTQRNNEQNNKKPKAPAKKEIVL